MAQLSLEQSFISWQLDSCQNHRPRPCEGPRFPVSKASLSALLSRHHLHVQETRLAKLHSRPLKRPLLRQASVLALAGAATAGPESKPHGDESRIEDAKLRVLGLVAGLDRGVAASQADTKRVLEAVEQLEKRASLKTFQEYSSSFSLSGDDSEGGTKYGLESMQGLWRLVYSSGFAAGSLGGLRPGPPTGRLPILVGQVLQRIDLPSRQLDNIVELRLNVLPWPLPAVDVTASLGHSFEVLGTATFRISFDKTTVNVGTYNDPDTVLPPLSTPDLPDFLRTPARSGQFETTYVDDNFRVSRGDLGELRVFVKA